MNRYPNIGEVIHIASKKGPFVVVGKGEQHFSTIRMVDVGKDNPKLTVWTFQGDDTNIDIRDITLIGKEKIKVCVRYVAAPRKN